MCVFVDVIYCNIPILFVLHKSNIFQLCISTRKKLNRLKNHIIQVIGLKVAHKYKCNQTRWNTNTLIEGKQVQYICYQIPVQLSTKSGIQSERTITMYTGAYRFIANQSSLHRSQLVHSTYGHEHQYIQLHPVHLIGCATYNNYIDRVNHDHLCIHWQCN